MRNRWVLLAVISDDDLSRQALVRAIAQSEKQYEVVSSVRKAVMLAKLNSLGKKLMDLLCK